MARPMNTKEVAQKAARIAAPVFEREGWLYGKKPDQRIPDTLDLYAVILELFEGMTDESTHSAGTGRFKVTRDTDPETKRTESLTLYLELGYVE